MLRRIGLLVVALAVLHGAGTLLAVEGERVTQEQIESGQMSLHEIRKAGLRMFATRFTKPHGFGDGPFNPADPVSPGGRPTLGGNGMLLRINGLDAQSCLECHSIVRADTVPPTLGIAGVGGSATNAIIKPTAIDPADLEDGDGIAGFNGRFANPPFLFGAGAVELLGLEMTADLQALKRQALAQPGVVFELTSKGVSFGSVVADANGNLDTSNVVGVDADLVVKPFGRKGEFATTREFDVEAMRFHFGMEPNEAVGEGVDHDGDGVYDELLVGELSALSVFATTVERPIQEFGGAAARRGFAAFDTLGCASCHRPALDARESVLPMRFPEVREDPTANVYLRINLTGKPMGFPATLRGGIRVPLFADLKRHDMGPGLAETFAGGDERFNREFTTARLWGIADTAPYLHDGRASTLFEAIEMHGGEAQAARDAFVALDPDGQQDLLAFLRTLRTPENPVADLLDDGRGAGRTRGVEVGRNDVDSP